MTQADQIRANLSSVRKELEEVLSHLTDETLAWAPAEGMRTVQGQLVEIIGTEAYALGKLKGQSLQAYEALEGELLECKSLEGLKRKLKDTRQVTREYLDTLSESELETPANVSEEFSNWIDLNPTPVSEVLRYIARHEAYHTGQLVSYLWAKGDNPYNWD